MSGHTQPTHPLIFSRQTHQQTADRLAANGFFSWYWSYNKKGEKRREGKEEEKRGGRKGGDKEGRRGNAFLFLLNSQWPTVIVYPLYVVLVWKTIMKEIHLLLTTNSLVGNTRW
jgi:hypothetical protein